MQTIERPKPPHEAPDSNAATALTNLLGGPAAPPLGYRSWAVFQWARDPFTLLITIYLFAPYFSGTVVGDPVRGQSLLGGANSLAGLIVALGAPFLGAIADKNGRRKPWILVLVVLAVPGLLLFWYTTPPGVDGVVPEASVIAVTLIAMVVVSVALDFSAVFHNAMLPSTAPAAKVGEVSGLAIALGNAAGVLLMLTVLYAFALPGTFDAAWLPAEPLFGLDKTASEHNRVVGPIVGVWLLVFSLPLFLFTPETSAGLPIRAAARAGLAEVWQTVRQARRYGNVGLYLLARMLFNDGLVGVLIFSGVYAAGTFGWGTVELLVIGIATSVSAGTGAFLGGLLDDRIGSKRTILLAVGGTTVLLATGVMIQPDAIFGVPHPEGQPLGSLPIYNTLPELLYFVNLQLFGMFVATGFAASRTMMARIAPRELMTQFFGLYALSGTATAFLAPLIVAITTDAFQSQRAGYASLMLLLAAGFLVMLFVREERAVMASAADGLAAGPPGN
ncbi:MAG: MFS transporter [Pseudomonadota bacterium]